VACSSKYGNEPLTYIKYGTFLDDLSVILASEEGLRSMEFVS
jgi:hypothetical protein